MSKLSLKRAPPVSAVASPAVEEPLKVAAASPDAPIALDTAKVSVRPSIGAYLQVQGVRLAQAGLYGGHALVNDIAVAVGALKQRTGAAKGHFDGELGQLIDHIHEML